MPPVRRSRSFTRLQTDDRRGQLLDAAAHLFAGEGYDGVAMRHIAHEAGVTKALLYHYFPSKAKLFAATLESQAGDLAARIATDPGASPAEQLSHAVEAYLGWIDEHSDAYIKMLETAGARRDVSSLIDRIREETQRRIVEALSEDPAAPPPVLRIAVNGWLWSMDGAALEWLKDRALPRDKLRDLLVAQLASALAVAHELDPGVRAL